MAKNFVEELKWPATIFTTQEKESQSGFEKHFHNFRKVSI